MSSLTEILLFSAISLRELSLLLIEIFDFFSLVIIEFNGISIFSAIRDIGIRAGLILF